MVCVYGFHVEFQLLLWYTTGLFMLTYTLRKLSVMTPLEKLFYTLFAGIGYLLIVLFGLWWFDSSHIPNNFSGWLHGIDFFLFVLVSYVVWYQIANEAFFWFVAFFIKHPLFLPPTKGLKVAFVTAFVPGSEPYEMLERTLSHMVSAQYPHDTWVLDEGNDEVVKALCKKYGVFHFSRKGMRRYNHLFGKYKKKTKGGNFNSWFDMHGYSYEFVAQIDVDFVPRKDFLMKTLGYFRDPKVAFVGSPQIYGNVGQSWIVKGAAEQAYHFYGAMQKGLFGMDMQLFIGANHVVRVAAHESISGYAGHIVEDHLTGMKFYSQKWKSVYVPEILAIGEGPSNWKDYFSQQMRWSYGLIDILFSHSPKIFWKLKPMHIFNYFFLQQHYFYGLAQVLGIMLLTFYFLFGIESTDMSFIPLLFLYVPLLIWQQIMFLWLQAYNIDPHKESGFMMRAKFLNIAVWPIYFLALIGIVFRKRLMYKVTPKGEKKADDTPFAFFFPHFVLGFITALDIAAAIYFERFVWQLLFFAGVNTILLWYFVASSQWYKVKLSFLNLKRILNRDILNIFRFTNSV